MEVHYCQRWKLAFPMALSLIAISAATATAELLIDCNQGQSPGDGITRGFYIPDYPGKTLDGIDLWFATSVAGERTFELTVRDGAYDGPLVGTAQATVDMPADIDITVETNFVFPSLEVKPGSTLTFEMALISGPGPMVYAVQPTTDCPVIQTVGTSPPLDTFRRDGIRIRVLGERTVAALEMTWSAAKSMYR